MQIRNAPKWSKYNEAAGHVNLIPWTSVHFLEIGFWCNWVVLNSNIIPIRFSTDSNPCYFILLIQKKKKGEKKCAIYSSASWRHIRSSNDDLREAEQHLTDIIVMRTIHHMVSDLYVKRHPAVFQPASCQFLRIRIHFIRHDDPQIVFDIYMCVPAVGTCSPPNCCLIALWTFIVKQQLIWIPLFG